MNRTLTYLLGPELVWLGMLAITGLISKLSQPLPANDHDKLLNIGWFLPALGVIFAFTTFFWAAGSHWWWLTRIGIASLIGSYFVVNFLCEAARYGDSRDSGIGSAFMAFIGLGWMVLFAMSFLAALCFLVKWPFLTVFKWLLIAIGGLTILGLLIGWLASFGATKGS
ncbi:hypothetical protein EXU85_25345 [Spirosoma sp. KCTC 42546]|uniref:hypothetical protein n=1 Tax=Spirosoma sp. KCTC 42546 TaxID=2520506 RepID=UPI001157B231|nr:hypothetical protein [Spirosoma sp. KCTC 42546]QDK81754.1 hypothetical protein EXU85_25345 [Spirosoma sp. KCTC 42546]